MDVVAITHGGLRLPAGPLVVVPVVTYSVHPRDEMIGLMGSLSLLFKNVLLATAPSGWVLYLGESITVMHTFVIFILFLQRPWYSVSVGHPYSPCPSLLSTVRAHLSPDVNI